ncbi:MAG: hypothetical protein HYX89_06225 [Chloroflexi bacterium]|nr:hypothetical protein [Chloroflexota bacterium]
MTLGVNSRRLALAAGLLLVLVFGAFLRFYRLGSVPPGLGYDEAYDGLDAFEIAQGNWALFFETNNGREPLFMYLAASFTKLFGPTVLSLRATSATLGLLAILAIFGFVYLLWRRQDRELAGWVALVATAGMAFSFWPVHLSRLSLRATALPLFETLAFLLLWLGVEKATGSGAHRLRMAILYGFLAGLLLGACLYIYPAARLLPALLLVFLLIQAALRWRWALAASIPILVAEFVALVTAVPLLRYLATHSFIAGYRLETLSLLDPANRSEPLAAALVGSARQVAGMFLVSGDGDWLFNLSGRPLFDWALGTWFLLGLLFIARRFRQPAATFALVTFVGMLFPAWLSSGAPHFLRAVGILPILYLFPAVALVTTGHWLSQRWAAGRSLVPTAIAALVLLTGLQTYRDYFTVYAQAPQLRGAFEADAADLASALVDLRPAKPVAVAARERSHPTIAYLTRRLPNATVFDPRRCSSSLLEKGRGSRTTYSRARGSMRGGLWISLSRPI